MTLPTEGAISLSQIAAEYEQSASNISLKGLQRFTNNNADAVSISQFYTQLPPHTAHEWVGDLTVGYFIRIDVEYWGFRIPWPAHGGRTFDHRSNGAMLYWLGIKYDPQRANERKEDVWLEFADLENSNNTPRSITISFNGRNVTFTRQSTGFDSAKYLSQDTTLRDQLLVVDAVYPINIKLIIPT